MGFTYSRKVGMFHRVGAARRVRPMKHKLNFKVLPPPPVHFCGLSLETWKIPFKANIVICSRTHTSCVHTHTPKVFSLRLWNDHFGGFAAAAATSPLWLRNLQVPALFKESFMYEEGTLREEYQVCFCVCRMKETRH